MGKRKNVLLVIAAALCMIVPASSLCIADDSGSPPPDPPVQKDWAVYIFCGADNDYEEAAMFALDQCVKGMQAAEGVQKDGTDPISVHVLMYLDAQGNGDTKVYEVTSEGAEPVDLMTESEYDSSSEATLVEFLGEAMVHYPGDSTMLIVKNGHAWCGVCSDWSSQDEKYLMPVNGLASALMDPVVTENGGVDVIALDGDNMASIEVVYELRNACDYFVGSQQDVPLDGLPYYLFLRDLASETVVPGAAEVAESIVNNYVLYYNNTDGKKIQLDHLLSDSDMAVTASAFEMNPEGGSIEDVVLAFNACIDWMMTKTVDVEGVKDPCPWASVYRNVISSARDTALIGKMGDQAGYEWLPDVYTWLVKIVEYYQLEESYPYLSEISGLVTDFTDEFNRTLVDMEQCQILNRSGNSYPHGLNIWFPPSWVQWESLDNSRSRTYLYDGSNVDLPAEYYCVDCPLDYASIDLDFVADTLWMDFFGLYYDSRWTIYGNPDAPRSTPLW